MRLGGIVARVEGGGSWQRWQGQVQARGHEAGGEEYGFVTWDFLLPAGSECLSARRPPLAIRIAHLVANRLNREYQHISKHGSKVASSIVTK